MKKLFAPMCIVALLVAAGCGTGSENARTPSNNGGVSSSGGDAGEGGGPVGGIGGSGDAGLGATDAGGRDAESSTDASKPQGAEDAGPLDAATPEPDAASAGSDGGSHWVPASDTTFYWDLTNANGDVNNAVNVGAYDIDGWNNDASEVAALHALGLKVVCYMDVGTYEPGRPDSSDFPSGIEGAAVQGWPGELWLDVRPSGPYYATLQSIMLARFQVCKSKGFDAVEPDNMDSYENSPGFPTTAADQLAYNEWVANAVHGVGLAVFEKNDGDQAATLEPYFDGILNEECNYYQECNLLSPYLQAGKPVWDAEYTSDGETTSSFCSSDVSAGIVGALFDLDLDGKTFDPCTNDVGKLN